MSSPYRSITSLRGEHRPDVNSDRHVAMLKGHLRAIMMQIAGDVPWLLEVVGQGPHNWGLELRRAFSPYPVSDGIIRATFRFFCDRVIAELGDPEKAVTEGMIADEAKRLAKVGLDGLELKPPPTEEDITRAWTMEDFSSEEHLREEHERDGRHPIVQFEKLIEQAADEARALGSGSSVTRVGKTT